MNTHFFSLVSNLVTGTHILSYEGELDPKISYARIAKIARCALASLSFLIPAGLAYLVSRFICCFSSTKNNFNTLRLAPTQEGLPQLDPNTKASISKYYQQLKTYVKSTNNPLLQEQAIQKISFWIVIKTP